MSYQIVQDNYERVLRENSDVYQHMNTLYHYALVSNTIIECGVRNVISTWALLKGLIDNPTTETKRLICCDIVLAKKSKEISKICKDLGIHFSFKVGNDLLQDFPKSDLIFVDTWHVYGQLIRELCKFESICQKYIIMHDTTVDEMVGESIREDFDIPAQCAQSHIPASEIKLGLWPAVVNFLGKYPQYRIKRREKYNNGLTILEKVEPNIQPSMIVVGTHPNSSIDRRMIHIWNSLPLDADVFFVRLTENLPTQYIFDDPTLWVKITDFNHYVNDKTLLHRSAEEFFHDRLKMYQNVTMTMTNDLIIDNQHHQFDLNEEGLQEMLNFVTQRFNIHLDFSDILMYA